MGGACQCALFGVLVVINAPDSYRCHGCQMVLSVLLCNTETWVKYIQQTVP